MFAAATVLSTDLVTEFGAPRGATGTRYAWLGGKQRAADTPGGLSIMGVRLYNPATGRFVQVDPVAGGSANAYDYAWQEPMSVFDLDGRVATGGGGGDLLGWQIRVCGMRPACEKKWWSLTPNKYKKCPPGFKAVGETLGVRWVFTTVDQARKGNKSRAVRSGSEGTAVYLNGKVIVASGRMQKKGSRLGRTLGRIGKLATKPVAIVATGIDYLC